MKAIAILSFLIMSTTQAANICKQPGMRLVGGTSFYKNFLSSTKRIKQDYTLFYQNVDDVLEDHINSNCPNTPKVEEELEVEHAQLCYKTCEEEAPKFHDIINTKMFKRSKVKKMINECKSVCDMEFRCEEDALCRAGL